MTTGLALHKDSYSCARTIEDGLKNHNIETLESGLSIAYDLFVNYTLEGHQEDLLALGRNLNSVYFPHRSKTEDSPANSDQYLGQLRALVNLTDYVSRHLAPLRSWQAVRQSKHASRILEALQKYGALRATDLSHKGELPNKTQLVRTIQPLVDEGLVRREKFGKNVWYALTSEGKLIVSKQPNAEQSSLLNDTAVQPLLFQAKNCLAQGNYPGVIDALSRIRSVIGSSYHPSVKSNNLTDLLFIAIKVSTDAYSMKKEFDLQLDAAIKKAIRKRLMTIPLSRREMMWPLERRHPLSSYGWVVNSVPFFKSEP